MSAKLDLAARINLRGAGILIADANVQALDIMRQILMGFGVRSIYPCDTVEEARSAFRQRTLELVIMDPLMVDEDGFEFIRWMRREEMSPNQTAPIIAAIGHHTLLNVKKSRDAGANFVVAKPLAPDTLLQRIEWVARETRQFVVAPNYAGPDRRFKNEGPPVGTHGRRADDLSFDVPTTADPNMSQFEVDELFKPRKVAL